MRRRRKAEEEGKDRIRYGSGGGVRRKGGKGGRSSGSVMTIGREISPASASVRRLLGTASRTANLDRLMNSLKKCAG